ncbi:MAG: SPFH domain-containing protein [Victivallaceae bacterium]|nr:SPFH domain-containing protein [Victivallaceae bacterium]
MDNSNTTVDNPREPQDSLYDAGLKSLVKSLRIVFLFLVIIILGMLIRFLTLEGYFHVKKSQEAVIVLRFGKYVDTFDQGWHWFMPYPIHKFITFRTNRQVLKVNFMPARTPAVPGSVPQGKPLVPGRDAYLITGDANIIHTEWVINYEIVNPKDYYLNTSWPPNPLDDDQIETGDIPGTRGPQTMLGAFLRDAVIQVTGTMKVDAILTRQKLAYKDRVYNLFCKNLAQMRCGIKIISLDLNNVAPPLSTRDAFTAVTNAGTAAAALVDKAKEYQVREENAVQTRVAQILADATVYKTEVVSQSRADSVYFDRIYKEYRRNPETVLMALYNNTLSDVLDKIDQKYIIAGRTEGSQQVRIKINPELLKEQANAKD